MDEKYTAAMYGRHALPCEAPGLLPVRAAYSLGVRARQEEEPVPPWFNHIRRVTRMGAAVNNSGCRCTNGNLAN